MNTHKRKRGRRKVLAPAPQGQVTVGSGVKKSLGQYFLKNPRVVAKMVSAAFLKAGDCVLEIGPGRGALTVELLAAGAQVIALEADSRMVAALCERFAPAIAAGALTVHHADVRRHPLALGDAVPKRAPYSIVSNIPYYLSGFLLRSALSQEHQPKCVVFLVQKEVAERIARGTKGTKKEKREDLRSAQPTRQSRQWNKESLLSLSVKAYGTPRYVATVGRDNFSPIPKVDSAILAIDHISRMRFADLDEAWFFKVLHAGFASRRKQLLGNLTVLRDRETLVRLFETLGIPQSARGEDLAIDRWCALAHGLLLY